MTVGGYAVDETKQEQHRIKHNINSEFDQTVIHYGSSMISGCGQVHPGGLCFQDCGP